MYACQSATFCFGIYRQFWCNEATSTNHSSDYRTHYARSFQYFLLSLKRDTCFRFLYIPTQPSVHVCFCVIILCQNVQKCQKSFILVARPLCQLYLDCLHAVDMPPSWSVLTEHGCTSIFQQLQLSAWLISSLYKVAWLSSIESAKIPDCSTKY